MSEIKAIVLNVNAGTVKVMDIEDELQTYYDLIGCDLIEIVDRRIGGKVYSIVCDEEGIFAEDAKVSAWDNEMVVAFFGNLVITNRNGPELASLTAEDVDRILGKVVRWSTNVHPEPYFMLTDVEYP